MRLLPTSRPRPLLPVATAFAVVLGVSAVAASPALTRTAPLASVLLDLVGARAAYTSTQSGAWSDAATWGGAGVPGTSDDVTVAAGHAVDITAGDAARSLTVETGALVQPRRDNGSPDFVLTVTGDVTNRGTIRGRNPDSFGNTGLYLDLGGDVTNEGTWDALGTRLVGAAAQTVTATAPLGNLWYDTTPTSPFAAGSDLTFSGRLELRGSRLDVGARRLAFTAGDGSAVFLGGGGTAAFTAGGALAFSAPTGSALAGVRVEGPVAVEGRMDVVGGVVMTGPVTVAAGAIVEQARSNGSDQYVLTVEGEITNRGTIRERNPDSFGGGTLVLDLAGDVANEGTWDALETRLVGAAAQTVTATAPLGNLWYDTTPTSPFAAGSDLTFSGRLELRGSRLDVGARRLAFTAGDGSAVFLGGGGTAAFTAGGALAFAPTASALTGVRVEGPVAVEGRMDVLPGVTMTGPVTVAAGAIVEPARANGSGDYVLAVAGGVTNRGTIRAANPDSFGGTGLFLDVGGDVVNEGTWDPYETRLVGAAAQTVTATAPLGRLWYDTTPTSPLTAGSDLTFSGRLELRGGRLDAGARRIAFTAAALDLDGGSGTLAFAPGGGLPGGTLAFTSSEGGALGAVRVSGPVTVEGRMDVVPGVTMTGPVTVAAGAIVEPSRNNGSPDFVLAVTGDVTNRGTIRGNNPDSFGNTSLYLDIGGDLVNAGTWTAAGTRLVGPRYHGVEAQRYLVGPITFEMPAVTPYGRVLLARDVGAGVQTVEAIAARFTADGNTGLDSLTVEAYGDRAPTTYGNAVRGQWALRPVPAALRTTLPSLTLRYRDAGLGTNAEALLQVYHSDDDGQTWQQVSTSGNLTRDDGANTVTLASAPAYGVYTLASSPDAVSVRPNVVFSVVGPDRIRVGPPNQYLLTYLNAGPAPTGEFLAALTTTAGIYVERVTPSATTPGLAPEPLLPDNFSPDGDSTHAVFYVPSLAPGEERTMTAILRTRADIESPLTSGAGGRAGAGPAIAFGGSLVGGAVGGAPASYLKDVFKATLVELVDDPIAANQAPDRAFARVNEEWFGGAEKGAGEIEGALQGELAGLAGRGSGLDRANALKEVADFLQELADADARREERWARARDGAPLGPNGGPFAGERIPIPQPDLPAAPPKTPTPVRSWDPNEKHGPQGVGSAGFVTALGRVTYQIKFENLAAATAPAYEVVVVDTLSAALDASTVEFGPTSFPGFVMTRVGNVLTWRGTGIELPPNQTPPEGEGFVQFSVETVPGLPDGTQIANRAEITFDINPPILTNTYLNTLDFTAPITTMTALAPAVQADSVVVGWAAADLSGGQPGSGVDRVTVFASRDGGPFVSVGVTEGSELVVGDLAPGTYAFYALATDAVGNAEDVRPALVTTTLTPVAAEEGAGGLVFALAPPSPNPSRGPMAFRFTLAESSPTRLEVFDVLGRRVVVLADGELLPGHHEVRWDAGAMASGVYIARLRQGDREQVRQLTVVR